MSRGLAVWITGLSWVAFVALIVVIGARSLAAQRSRPARTEAQNHWSMFGMALEAVAVLIAITGESAAVAQWRLWVACVLAPLGAGFALRGALALGRHFRAQAVVTSDHELITTGPYAVVRHPIYAGLLALVVSTGLVRNSWLRLAIAIAVYCAGTEVRVWAEEQILERRFPNQLAEYRKRVKAYIPFVR